MDVVIKLVFNINLETMNEKDIRIVSFLLSSLIEGIEKDIVSITHGGMVKEEEDKMLLHKVCCEYKYIF